MPIFGAKSRAKRGCASKLACGHRIGPAGCTGFTEILVEFLTSHWADRVVGPYGEISMHSYPCRGGRLCPPAEYIGFTEIFGEIATSRRADVGIGPYRTPANPYFPANFERKAFLPQPFEGNYYQFRCTVTGGAYLSVRKVTMCARNG